MTDQLTDYMEARLQRTRERQAADGRHVNLTTQEYLNLHTPTQLKKLAMHIEAGTIDGFLGSKWGYVLGWVDKAAFQYGLLDIHTAKVMTRTASKEAIKLKRGDKQTEKAKRKISKAKKGVPQSEAHIAKRAAALTGQKRQPMSEEAKAKLRATRAARKAAKSGAHQ